MASYPGPKVHRSNRRKLGKGQYPSVAAIGVTVTDSGSIATLTFARPVVVSGQIPMTVSGGLTIQGQTIVSPTVVTQLYSGALSTHTYSIPSGAANVSSYQGGQILGASGTFS